MHMTKERNTMIIRDHWLHFTLIPDKRVFREDLDIRDVTDRNLTVAVLYASPSNPFYRVDYDLALNYHSNSKSSNAPIFLTEKLERNGAQVILTTDLNTVKRFYLLSEDLVLLDNVINKLQKPIFILFPSAISESGRAYNESRYLSLACYDLQSSTLVTGRFIPRGLLQDVLIDTSLEDTGRREYVKFLEDTLSYAMYQVTHTISPKFFFPVSISASGEYGYVELPDFPPTSTVKSRQAAKAKQGVYKVLKQGALSVPNVQTTQSSSSTDSIPQDAEQKSKQEKPKKKEKRVSTKKKLLTARHCEEAMVDALHKLIRGEELQESSTTITDRYRVSLTIGKNYVLLNRMPKSDKNILFLAFSSKTSSGLTISALVPLPFSYRESTSIYGKGETIDVLHRFFTATNMLEAIFEHSLVPVYLSEHPDIIAGFIAPSDSNTRVFSRAPIGISLPIVTIENGRIGYSEADDTLLITPSAYDIRIPFEHIYITVSDGKNVWLHSNVTGLDKIRTVDEKDLCKFMQTTALDIAKSIKE